MSQLLFHTASTPDQPNILGENSGHIRIADFGLSKTTKNPNSIQGISCQNSYTIQWAAPEALIKEYSDKADVFSLATVMIDSRGTSQVQHVLCEALAYLLSLASMLDIHTRRSFQRCFAIHGYVDNNTRQAPVAADTSIFHGKLVDVDATLLGW